MSRRDNANRPYKTCWNSIGFRILIFKEKVCWRRFGREILRPNPHPRCQFRCEASMQSLKVMSTISAQKNHFFCIGWELFLYTWASFLHNCQNCLPEMSPYFSLSVIFVCKKKWAKMFVWCSKFSKKNWKHLFHLAPDISLQPPQPKLRQQLWCVVRIFVSNYFSYFWLISTKITIRSRQAEDHRTCSSFVFSASICGM